MPTRQQHPVEYLFNELQSVKPYPDGVKCVPKVLSGTAFFPGGCGLWLDKTASWYTLSDRPDMPTGEIMILGHNFDSEAGYRETQAVVGQHELNPKYPTWRNLLELLQDAGIEPKNCFFTNAYMGLRKGERNTGKFPGARCPGFVERCRSFLNEQIEAQKPRLILTLGLEVPWFIEPLSSRLKAWRGYESFKDLDAAGPLISDVHFEGTSEQPITVVALVHPAAPNREDTLKKRHYRGIEELSMLKDALNLY